MTTATWEDDLIEHDAPSLVHRLRDGDADAFGQLVATHRTSALRVAAVVLGTSQGADDVVQDATVRAWRAAASVDPSQGFRAWYLRIVANTARNDRRSRGRRAALQVRVAGVVAAGSTDPSDEVVSDEERRRVVAALNRLDRDDRLVLALRHFEELSGHEIATVLGCAPGTVKSRTSRAIARLRRELT